MIILKWLASAALHIALLPTVAVAAPIISLFTRPMPHKLPGGYRWGWIWGTYDNPAQGDEGFVAKRAPFPGITTGIKGYINRVMWMIRNPLYGLNRKTGVWHGYNTVVAMRGNPLISDKYRVPGWLLATAHNGRQLIAFELYVIAPWSRRRCLRLRLGWKIKGRKFAQKGDLAPLVTACNPLDSYGND